MATGKKIVAAAGALLLLLTAAHAAELGEDGLYEEAWFAQSKDIGEDVATAARQGKRVAVLMERQGCTSCKQLHEKVFADDEVRRYISENFLIVQLNVRGEGMVTDLDGEVLSEWAATAKWDVVFTPTFFFLPETSPDDASVADAAVFKMSGFLPETFVLPMFRWVREEGYEGNESLYEYLARLRKEALFPDRPAR
jgi:thioredoxin-related protein